MARKSKQKAPNWKDIEKKISKFEKTEFTELLRDLYHLSPENKTFFLTRFSIGEDTPATYRRIIQNAMNPEIEEGHDLEIEKAHDAIKRFTKAVDDPHGEADLRIYYVECGNNFTLSYGDIDGDFYDDILQMYEYAIETVLELPKKDRKAFKTRLHDIMESADGIGWGYSDGLCELYNKSFPDDSLRKD